MRVLIAPDSFKECLSASEAASAIAEGVLEVCGNAQIDLCPMADGGEGTVGAMISATGGRLVTADVFGPLGAPIRAHFGLLGPGVQPGLPGELGLAAAAGLADGQGAPAEGPGGVTAVVEMAAASGLALVGPEHRDPMRTTTFGTGQLILSAVDAGAAEVLVGVGGSATVDGGCGCAQAMGVTFIGADGNACVCGLGGGGVGGIGRIDVSDRDPRLADVRIRVACDVKNPLLGPQGAAAIYAPQKGATVEMVAELETALAHLAEVIRRDLGVDVADLPGAGAAGGLAAGLVAFAGATIESGLDLVAEAVALRRRAGAADLCITGEGRLDAQSSAGKTTVGVAEIARAAGVPVACIAGQVADDAPVDAFTDVRALAGGTITPAVAVRQAPALLKRRAGEVIRQFLRD